MKNIPLLYKLTKEILDPKTYVKSNPKLKDIKLPSKGIITFPYVKYFLSKIKTHFHQDYYLFGTSVGELKLQNNKIICAIVPGPGGAFTAGVIETLHTLGLKELILVGSTGVLQSHIERGSIIIPNEAIRDEGTSYHYLPPFRKAKPSNVLTQKLKKSCLKYGIIPYEGKTWTTDAFFRETYEKRDYFRKNGAICVEMEASGAFAVAEYRKIKLAALLIASDSIANNKWNNRKSKEEIKKYKETQKKMFQIVMDTLCQK